MKDISTSAKVRYSRPEYVGGVWLKMAEISKLKKKINYYITKAFHKLFEISQKVARNFPKRYSKAAQKSQHNT